MTDTSDFSDDEIFAKYRKRRINDFKKQKEVKELKTEEELMKKSMSDTMIVHFYKEEFLRCKIMNEALERVCHKFRDIDFYKAKAENCLVITEKLNIQALPFLGFFHKGFFVDYIVGFEKIGENELKEEELISFIKNSNIYK
ncbi:thioredoxin [Tubulinosema ratisbonensis]|uniref:Thioredoxin n=1 Tax=Tubulinosema ratisbonensis TaxID=291195 RepID=A0A437ALL2_9MICR|nr:thioredoxin [Tubulinosema ratisbonensis]